jgi:hypothetical protein
MNGQPNSLEASLRVVRLVHLVLLVSIPLYFVLPELLSPKGSGDLRLMRGLLSAMALLSAGFAVVFRKRVLEPAADSLRLRPEDAAALVRWRAAHIISFALCESVALFGLVLRFLGATTFEAAPFFAVAFVLMLAFRPSAP